MIQVDGYRVLVKPDPLEKLSRGGIVLPLDAFGYEVAQEYGTLVQIGPLAWKEANRRAGMDLEYKWFNIGDRVLYSKYGGKLLVDEETEEKYVVLNDEDVLAKVSRQ